MTATTTVSVRLHSPVQFGKTLAKSSQIWFFTANAGMRQGAELHTWRMLTNSNNV